MTQEEFDEYNRDREAQLRPSRPIQLLERSQADFVGLLNKLHDVAGSWFLLSCNLSAKIGKPVNERRLFRWKSGDGPPDKKKAYLFPILEELLHEMQARRR